MQAFELNTGYAIPAVAFGTWDVRGAAGQGAIESALEVGYRAIDTAFMYENHDIVGAAIAASGIARADLFVTTKLNGHCREFARASDAIKRALEELRLDYLDLALVHEPYRESTEMYRACEEAQEAGLVRSIGVSNFDEAHLQRILDECDVVPAIDQCECHVFYPQLSLKRHLSGLGSVMQSWAPFTEGRRPVFSNEALASIAQAHEATVGQVALAYLLDEDIPVCVKSADPARQAENLAAADVHLADEDRALIAQLDEGASLFGWYDEGWL